MKKLLISISIVLLSFNTFAQKNSRWKLIYHNDKSGNAVKGKIENLIQAVRNGKQIRVNWYFQHPKVAKIKVEHFADSKFLTVLSDQVVLAQIEPIIGQKPDFDDQNITFRENLEWSLIASSKGKCDTMTRNRNTGEVVEHKFTNFEIKWFVEQ